MAVVWVATRRTSYSRETVQAESGSYAFIGAANSSRSAALRWAGAEGGGAALAAETGGVGSVLPGTGG